MIFYCALSIGRVFSATIKTCPNVHQVHNFVLTIEMSINMQNNEQTEYKTVRGLTRGLMLLNMLNKLDGGASVGLLDRKSTRLNSSHVSISYAVFCLKTAKYQALRPP